MDAIAEGGDDGKFESVELSKRTTDAASDPQSNETDVSGSRQQLIIDGMDDGDDDDIGDNDGEEEEQEEEKDKAKAKVVFVMQRLDEVKICRIFIIE